MDKSNRKQFQNDEEKLLIAKIKDKIRFCKTKNKIVNTDFLQISEVAIAKKALLEEKISNYFFFGGRENSDRNILVIYPEKLTEEIVKSNISNILGIIRIVLPNELNYEHRDYLSGIMKLGIKREKFGDILVSDKGADIVVLKEVATFLINGLSDLTRFRKSKIDIVNINEIENIEPEFENIKIIVSSCRLDNFVSELANCSRNQAEIIIDEQRVFINLELQYKYSKKVNKGDIITIRGKGKFIYTDIERQTKSGKFLVIIKKYK